jgi:hypothetical protein
MKIITKEQLINELRNIKNSGWIKNARHGNVGGIGNTLEDILGIEENNLPIPNAAEWELKTQRANTSSLTTLFHMEPSPRAFNFVPQILLPNYGWKHEKAEINYPENEMSFRQTISGKGRSDRGFMVVINRSERKVKKEKGKEYFMYDKILMLQKFSIDKFLLALENNDVLVDFDARTGHNHGTKFRLRQNRLPDLYDKVTEI